MLGPSLFVMSCPITIGYALRAFVAAKDRVLSALALAIAIGIPGTIFALFLSS
jgi:hypothetical protein